MARNRQSQITNRTIYTAVLLWAAVYIFITAFKAISPILLTFLLILLISLALNPVVRWLRKLGGRMPATMVVVALFLAVIGLTAWAFYSPVKRSTAQFVDRLPEYWERIQKPLLKIEERAAVSERKLKTEVTNEIVQEEAGSVAPQPPPPREEAEPEGGFIRSGLSQLLTGLAGAFRTLAANTATIVVVCLAVFFGVIFTLISPRPVFSVVFWLVPEQHHEKALRVTQRIVHLIPRWALATLLGMAVVGTLVFLAMWPILGLQDAIVMAAIAFVLEAVPFIGPILSAVPAVLLALGKGGWAPLWVIIAYLVIQAIENHVVAPVIVAGRLKLHPIPAVFSIFVSIALFGVLGFILAVPAVAIIQILYDELYRPRFLPDVSQNDVDELTGTALNDQSIPRRARKFFHKPDGNGRMHAHREEPGNA